MLEEPTSLRIDDPGVRALFTEAARFQSWLDVEAALAQAQAELGVIPEAAAREIARKSHLSSLDLAAVREGLARTGHPLVPLVWALDRACEGDAGGYVHWGATTQNITQTGQLLQVRHVSAGLTSAQVEALLDPARYTGLCRQFAERGAAAGRELAASIGRRLASRLT
jgi:adenylosuccinate lyase